MSPELAQWIPPAVIIGVMLYLHRMTRQDMKQMESRLSGRIDGVESKIENLRDRMDSQNGGPSGPHGPDRGELSTFCGSSWSESDVAPLRRPLSNQKAINPPKRCPRGPPGGLFERS